MKNKKRHYIYLRMAIIWGENSKARKKRVGCLIIKDNRIISDGYNGTPHGFDINCEHMLEGKLITRAEVLHAESNAITKLAKSTQSGEGSILYVAIAPCFDCSKLIIQANIKEVVYLENYKNLDGINLLKRANIKVIKMSAINCD